MCTMEQIIGIVRNSEYVSDEGIYNDFPLSTMGKQFCGTLWCAINK